jgi:hypothetical protein
MLPTIKYFNVNWVDGMKLTRSHFSDQENAFTDRLRDVAGINLTSYNYGLLEPVPGSAKSIDQVVDVDKATLLRVKINECRAITPGGVRIEVLAGNPLSQSKPLSAEYNLSGSTHGTFLYIVLSVNPFGKSPLGEPNAEENPPRYPFTDYKYEINVMPAEQVNLVANGAYHITIGKLKVVGNGVEVIEKYIPPCAKVCNHRDLMDIYNDLDKMLSRLESDATLIVQKIYRKDQQNILAKNVLFFTDNLLRYLSTNIHHFRWFVPEMPPIFMVEYFASFARLLKNSLDMKAGTGKEEMLNYFKDWIVEVNQGEFEGIVDQLVNIQYNHMDINESIEKIEAFSVTLSTVMNKLSKLDYIGDKKKTDVIVTSRGADVVDTPKKRSFLLD